jgi:hypothetical protein
VERWVKDLDAQEVQPPLCLESPISQTAFHRLRERGCWGGWVYIDRDHNLSPDRHAGFVGLRTTSRLAIFPEDDFDPVPV